MKHLSYMGYLLKHKTRVLVHAIILGIPLRGLLHDLSKLHPMEWRGIGRQFFPSTPEEKDANVSLFQQAKAHHRTRNPHEVDHWYLDDHTCKAIPVPVLKEIMADWAAFGCLCLSKTAIRNKATLSYQKWGKNYRMNPDTRIWIEGFLGINSTENGEPRVPGDA